MAIVYSSDVIIRDPVELATHAVFFDETLLPWATPESSKRMVAVLGSQVAYVHWLVVPSQDPKPWDWGVGEWERENAPLFADGAFTRLGPYHESAISPDWDLSHAAAFFARSPIQLASGEDAKYLHADLVEHWLRRDVGDPQVYRPRQASSARKIFVAAEVKAAFSYLLPALTPLEPEQLLRVRNEVKDTREGFAMHLQKLSKALNEVDSSNIAEVMREAQNLIETELIPDYVEFRRQLTAKRTGWWRRVMGPVVRVLEIDAAPWTPKFYGQILKALGVPGWAVIDESEHTNESAAYHFMSSVETLHEAPDARARVQSLLEDI